MEIKEIEAQEMIRTGYAVLCAPIPEEESADIAQNVEDTEVPAQDFPETGAELPVVKDAVLKDFSEVTYEKDELISLYLLLPRTELRRIGKEGGVPLSSRLTNAGMVEKLLNELKKHDIPFLESFKHE